MNVAAALYAQEAKQAAIAALLEFDHCRYRTEHEAWVAKSALTAEKSRIDRWANEIIRRA